MAVKWHYAWTILAIILAAQMGMGVATMIWCRNVFCKDDSNLGMARLLRDVVEEMEEYGTAADGERIWEFLKGTSRWRYAAVRGEMGEMRLQMVRDGEKDVTEKIRIGTKYL